MRRALAAVAAAVAVVFLVGLALGWFQGESHRPPARPFAAKATLSSRSVAFGDRLGARLDLVVDPRTIQPNSIHVSPRFAPYRIVGTSAARKTGDGVLLSYRYLLECLEPVCAPQTGQTDRRFLPIVVSFRTHDGGPGIQAVNWPGYRLLSRLSAADRSSPSPVQLLRYDATVPPPSYRIDPGTLRALLVALCVVLALAAAALAWLALGRGRGRARGPALSPLQRALAAVRASTANGHVDERRRALGWLGRELGAVERGDEARGATRLAWSENAPTPESTGAFADDVEAAR